MLNSTSLLLYLYWTGYFQHVVTEDIKITIYAVGVIVQFGVN